MTYVKNAAWLGVATLAGLMAAQVPAQAQIPSATGVYTACVRLDRDRDESRRLRLIDPARERCDKNEMMVTWNAQGQKGDKGDQGAQGVKGDKGDQGANAAAGQQCTPGSVVVGFDSSGNIICRNVPRTYAIGDTGPAGGIVFYVTDGGLHGLEAAPEDQYNLANPGQGGHPAWGCIYDVAFATGTAVGTGAQNTANMLNYCAEAGSAARVAHGYALNNYDGWFLPSKDELNLLYQQKAVVGGIFSDTYWSSTEIDNVYAWYQNFNDGSQAHANGKDLFLGVRAIRAF